MPHSIRLGICCPPGLLPTARALGFDYAELGLAALAALPDDEYRRVAESLPGGFRVEAVNGLLPGTIRLSDERYDPAECREYLDRAYTRAVPLGLRVAVFGSGASRRLVDTFPRDKAMAQLADFGRVLAEKSAEYGVTAVVEPLCRAECNVLNTVAEGVAYAREVASPHLAVLADLYHVGVDGEPIDDIVHAGALLRHCHIANPVGRTAPKPGDAYDYRPFFDALRTIGYDGRVSIEGSLPAFESDASESLAYLRELSK